MREVLFWFLAAYAFLVSRALWRLIDREIGYKSKINSLLGRLDGKEIVINGLRESLRESEKAINTMLSKTP